MNKLIRLSHSGIEYLDYVWNFYSGCWNWKNGICQVEKCWAKGITERFKQHYPNGFEPTYYPEAFLSPLYLKKPSIIGVAFMGDLFGDWVDPNMKIHSSMPSGKASITMSLKGWITTTIKQCPQHTFLFLTKCPQNLIKWEFPENAWVGVTATNQQGFLDAVYSLVHIKGIRYISFEPLLAEIPMTSEQLSASCNWLIIGACTGTHKEMIDLCLRCREPLTLMPWGKRWTAQPRIEDLREIVQAADKAGIPVFLKNNLEPLIKWPQDGPWAFKEASNMLRQEMPIEQ